MFEDEHNRLNKLLLYLLGALIYLIGFLIVWLFYEFI